jgi:uncharacterized protein (UPF0333 family)
MKNHFTTTFLNVLLGFLILASVAFTFLVIHRETKADDSALQARQANNSLVRVNAILNDTATYNTTARDPQLAHILQVAQETPATR